MWDRDRQKEKGGGQLGTLGVGEEAREKERKEKREKQAKQSFYSKSGSYLAVAR